MTYSTFDKNNNIWLFGYFYMFISRQINNASEV